MDLGAHRRRWDHRGAREPDRRRADRGVEARGADRDRLRPLRRAGPRAGRPVDHAAVRAGRPRRLHLRSRDVRRQGQLLRAPASGTRPGRRRRAGRERARPRRRRGGDRRPFGDPPPGGRRRRLRRGGHLRRQHGECPAARDHDRPARAGRGAGRDPHRHARAPLGPLRRRRGQPGARPAPRAGGAGRPSRGVLRGHRPGVARPSAPAGRRSPRAPRSSAAAA